MRHCPDALALHFDAAVAAPSDINEHLQLLREYAAKCEHVTEFGMRGASGSTVALLAAQPTTFISWDINPLSVVTQALANLIVMNSGGRTFFQPRVGDTLKIQPIEPTDMLFIDTLHTAKQLRDELLRHGTQVRKYIAFHDTATFGCRGEDGSEPGLRTAIRWFQREHQFPLWELVEDRDNNNGLAVIQRIDVE